MQTVQTTSAPVADQSYQGWSNRETWCIALWLNNEQGSQEWARAACNQPDEMLHEAAQSLEDLVDDLLGEVSGFTLDIINCALSRVNWPELAASFRENA